MTVQTRDLRRASRKRVLMRMSLITVDGVQEARVRDLTSSGAGIACDSPPRAGSDVILKRGDLFLAARVVWSESDCAGLEFYREVPLAELGYSVPMMFEGSRAAG